MDLNADVGEGAGDDAALFPLLTSVNVACGFHAGDPLEMERTVRDALAAGVAVGAHPSYADREGFGRRAVEVSPERLQADVTYQVGALAAFVTAAGAALAHVKAHGALYHRAAHDDATADAVAQGAARAGAVAIVGPCGAVALPRAAARSGLRFVSEAFADRRYGADGRLLPRDHPQALLVDPREAAEQAVLIVAEGRVRAVDGSYVRLRAETLCVHGDTPGAPAIARAVRDALHGAGIALAPLGR